MELARQDVEIEASRELVYEYLTSADGVEWIAIDATVDARVGGTVRWNRDDGMTVAGKLARLISAQRVVFSYGWERNDRYELPPGSSTVEIELTAVREGHTRLRLRDLGVPAVYVREQDAGWGHFLRQLAQRLDGGGYEIRTREGFIPTRFPSVRPRPLGESSVAEDTGRLSPLAGIKTAW